MKRIGNIDYPDTVYTIMADPALAPVWVEYCKAAMLLDSHEFLMALRQPIDPRKLYHRFISYDGEYPLNVGNTTRAIADQLAADKEWDSPYWFSIFSALRDELLTLLNAQRLSSMFWKHDIFLDHHVRVNNGNANDASTTVNDPVLTESGHAAAALGLADSPILKRAMGNFDKEGETLRTWSLFQDYIKQQKSTLRAQDAVKILIANGVLSAPEDSAAYKIAQEMGVTDVKLFEKFYADFKQVRGDGHALWNLLDTLIKTIGKGGTPALLLRRLDRINLLPPHADALAPGEDYDVPPAAPEDDDMPPPPPPLEGEDEGQDADAINPDDLPPPPSYGDVANYPDHIAAIEQLLPGRDKAKLAKAFGDLRAAMTANGECPPDVTVKQIATEVVTLVNNKRRAEAERADPFPDTTQEADPFPPRPDPFPDTDADQDDPFPDTGPTGVDLSGLEDADATAAADDGDDPFPGAPGDGQPRPPRGPDPFPDADDAQSDAGSDAGASGSAGGGDAGDTSPRGGGGGDAPLRGGGASDKQLKSYLQREVTNIAGMLGKNDQAGAKTHAITVSKNMTKLGGPDVQVPAKSILSAAMKEVKRPTPSDVSTLTGGVDADAASVSGQTELSNGHANKADWKSFAKLYMLSDEDVQTSKQIGLSIAKNGLTAPNAIGSAKKLADKISKDKAAKFKFKNHRHVMAAVFQLMMLKANQQKLLKTLKASEVADVVAIPEDA